MKRDGANQSAWQFQFQNYTSKNARTTLAQHYDVVIIGGGITGVTTALQLQKAGKKCLLTEAYTLGFGTTGGTTAHLNTVLDNTYHQIEEDFGEENAKLVLETTRNAIRLAAHNVRNHQIKCDFKELPGYLFSQNEKQTRELEDTYEASLRAGCDVEYADSLPLPIDFEKALIYSNQAQFHPVKYLFALAAAFEGIGGHIVQRCRVTDVSKKDDYLEVTTEMGNTIANDVVYATHVPPGVNLLHFRCAPYRSYAMAVSLKDNSYPDCLAYDLYDPYHYYRTQQIDGNYYLIAGGEDHKTGEEPDADSRFARLQAYLAHYFDIGEVAFKWSSQYFQSADGLPYIGHLPGNPENVWVATGFGGNGITFGHVAAQVLTELIVNGESEYEDIFSPSRVKPVAGFANFVKENADVASKLIAALIPPQKLEDLSDIKNNESRIIKYEGHSIALYKDTAGKLHAVNQACTHLACSVSWNNTEKTWECPCHGSRFGIDGQVLTAPARKGLEQINLLQLPHE